MPTITATTPELWTTLIEICNQLGIATSTLPTLTTPQEIMEFMHTLNIDLQPLYSEVTTLEQTGWTWVYNAPVNPAETTDMVVRGVTDLTVVGGGATGIAQGKKIFGTVSKKIAAMAMVAALGVSTFAAQIGEHIAELAEGLKPWTTDGDDAVPVMIDENGTTYFDERAINKFRSDLAELGIFDTTPMYPEHETTGAFIYTGTTSIRSVLNQLLDESLNTFTWTDQITNALNTFLNQWDVGYPAYIWVTSRVNSTAYDSGSAISIYVYRNLDNSQIGNEFYLNNTPSLQPRRFTIGGKTTSPLTQNITLYNYSEDYSNVGYKIGKWTDTTFINASTINATEGGGVPGFEPTNTTVGDLTKSLTDIFPDWTDNAVTLPSPKDDDLTNTADWLPVSINDTDIQDHTATSDDQDGDTSEDAQQSIMEKLMELIQTLAQEQAGTDDEVITPTIPVEDSGDSPPATPPLVSGASNGLWTIYNPTLSEVQQFGAWLWSENIIDQIVRQFASPIDGVIGFMSIYCTPITGGRKMIKAGYLESPVSAKEVTNQYVTIDCGSVDVPEYYRTAIDYTRSKVDIYLPFIGIVPLDCSVVTGSTLQVIYRIDVLTGTCLAQIKVIKQNSDAVMYTFNGNCGVQLPLTGGTYTGLVSTLIGLGKAAIGAYTGNAKSIASGLIQAVGSAGADVMKSGTLTSNAGALGIRIPYLIITHPTAYDAMIYNQFYGYPSNVYQRLSAMSGFVRVKKVHLDDITCTDQELEMIYSKLKEGVII